MASRPTKRTMRELANSITQEGKFELENYCYNTYFRYYRAFGQRWCLTYTSGGTLKRIEQVDELGRRVGF